MGLSTPQAPHASVFTDKIVCVQMFANKDYYFFPIMYMKVFENYTANMTNWICNIF